MPGAHFPKAPNAAVCTFRNQSRTQRLEDPGTRKPILRVAPRPPQLLHNVSNVSTMRNKSVKIFCRWEGGLPPPQIGLSVNYLTTMYCRHASVANKPQTSCSVTHGQSMQTSCQAPTQNFLTIHFSKRVFKFREAGKLSSSRRLHFGISQGCPLSPCCPPC